MEKRDLKADLELCNRATPGPWEAQPFVTDRQRRYEVFDATGQCVCTLVDAQSNAAFIAQAREGWPHAIERAIKAEKALGNETILNGKALAKLNERADKAEALARGLADTMKVMLPRYLTGRLDLDLDMVYEAKRLISKAEEVLGDGREPTRNQKGDRN